jgi:endonuclease/exonuclease/phosphatase family metal-dependent hydrolase
VGDKFEREPFYASFKSDNFDYTIILMHSDFDRDKEVMRREARHLSGVFKAVQDGDPKENDVLLIGDFNLSASDQGWDKLKSLPTVVNLVPAPTLTTINPTGKLSSAYDNIWIQKQFTEREFAGTANADYCFDKVFSNSANPGKAWRQKVSDHVPVYAVFYTDKADDD